MCLGAESAGDIPTALRRAQEARALAQQLGDAESEATACVALSYAHIRLGHYPAAQTLLAEALALSASASPARAEALLDLGICAGETDDLVTAEAYFQQAVDLSRELGLDRVLVRGLHSMATGIYTPRGEFALALACDEEALKLARGRGLPELAWGPLVTMSWVHWLTGQRKAAEFALAELRAVALPGSLAEAYDYLTHAGLALDAGATAEAQQWLIQARANAEASGIAEALFFARLGMSRLCRLTDDAPSARAWAAYSRAPAARSIRSPAPWASTAGCSRQARSTGGSSPRREYTPTRMAWDTPQPS